MEKMISRSWWMFAWRGAVAVLFGVLALVWPGLTLLWLVALFAAFALLGGGAALIAGIKNRKSDEDWWLALLLGLVGLAAGVIAILHPDLSALVLVLWMGANAIVTGVLDIAMAIRLRKVFRGECLLIPRGLRASTLSVLGFRFPAA